MLRIAHDCAAAGHEVTIYTGEWRGDMPGAGIRVEILPSRGWLNHQRRQSLINAMLAAVKNAPVDLVVGFNRMAGLDVYFAADPCYVQRAHEERSWLYRLSGRYRFFSGVEKAVMDPQGNCHILLLTEREKHNFQRYYNTPDARFHLLPPFISADRMQLQDKAQLREKVRREFDFGKHDHVLLMVGSGFRTKGLDRAIEGLAALPLPLRNTTSLLAVGQDNPKSFQRLAKSLGMESRVRICAGRSDVPQLMQGADLLVHPARRELAGHVLLEAMLSELPVLVTDVCGYAGHVKNAGAGVVLAAPFCQSTFNETLQAMLVAPDLKWGQAGRQYMQALLSKSSPTAEANLLVELALNKKQGRI